MPKRLAYRNNMSEHLVTTTSLCPQCLDPVPGSYVARGDSVHLTRECPDHGTLSRKVWESRDHWEWAGDLTPNLAGDPSGRVEQTDANSELTVANDHACLAVIEVTTDCNLSCSYCFASSGPGGDHLPTEAVIDRLDTVRSEGGPRPIQFSGGEPTVRDDLPELIQHASEMGFESIQVNTNGIRLAQQDGYACELAEAGVTAVYLQFDGLTAETYEAIRETDLSDTKREAITACQEADLSVTLVPTVVPGVNDHEMGAIVAFALDHRDVVESVNFQPVAHFGRYATHDERFSLDAAARSLAEQVESLSARDLLPVPCCSSYCQLATALVPGDNADRPVPVSDLVDEETFAEWLGLVDESDWMGFLTGTGRESSSDNSDDGCCAGSACCGPDVSELTGGLFEDVIPVSITGFMDADAADVSRLENCCISVPTPDGELVPFCGYNMTDED